MKRFILFVFVLLLFFSLINAQLSEFESKIDDINGNFVDKTKDVKDSLEKEGIKFFLEKDWSEDLKEFPLLNDFIVFYEDTYNLTKPFFIYTVGVSPSLSFSFLMTVTLFVVFLILFYGILAGMSTFSKGISSLLAILLSVVLGNLGFIKGMSFSFVWFLSLFEIFNIWWVQIILIIFLFIFLFILVLLSAYIKDFFKKYRKERKKIKEEFEMEMSKRNIDSLSGFAKQVNNKLE